MSYARSFKIYVCINTLEGRQHGTHSARTAYPLPTHEPARGTYTAVRKSTQLILSTYTHSGQCPLSNNKKQQGAHSAALTPHSGASREGRLAPSASDCILGKPGHVADFTPLRYRQRRRRSAKGSWRAARRLAMTGTSPSSHQRGGSTRWSMPSRRSRRAA